MKIKSNTTAFLIQYKLVTNTMNKLKKQLMQFIKKTMKYNENHWKNKWMKNCNFGKTNQWLFNWKINWFQSIKICKNVLNFKILFPRIIFEFLIKKNNDI